MIGLFKRMIPYMVILAGLVFLLALFSPFFVRELPDPRFDAQQVVVPKASNDEIQGAAGRDVIWPQP